MWEKNKFKKSLQIWAKSFPISSAVGGMDCSRRVKEHTHTRTCSKLFQLTLFQCQYCSSIIFSQHTVLTDILSVDTIIPPFPFTSSVLLEESGCGVLDVEGHCSKRKKEKEKKPPKNLANRGLTSETVLLSRGLPLPPAALSRLLSSTQRQVNT